jgi:D-alanyl-D-alanine carboxypeptidase
MLRAGAFRRDIENPIRAGHTAHAFTEGMNHASQARSEARRAVSVLPLGLAVVTAVVIAALLATVGHPSAPSSVASAASVGEVPRGDHHAALGEADGLVPGGASVFDDQLPAIANLDPDLLKALRRAATDAAKDGVEFQINSGWRSPEYQEQLLRAAISEYGSAAEAARWVGTPTTSAHVSGDAVDIGPVAAAEWLSEHGVNYGLCQVYRNEPWHYEQRPAAARGRCPAMYVDPTHDPKMQP